MSEVVFDVTREDLVGYAAECPTENLSVTGCSWEEMRANVKDAVLKHFQDGPKPIAIRLHLVRDEVISLE
jgi:hypothetical protein